MARPQGARDRQPRRRRQQQSIASGSCGGIGDALPDVNITERRVQEGYARAQALVTAIRALPQAIIGARPPGWKAGRGGLPALTSLLLTAIHCTVADRTRISHAWHYVLAVERFLSLAPPVAQNRALAIEKILARLPAAEQTAQLPMLLTASYVQLQLTYQNVTRRHRPPRPRRDGPRARGELSPGALWYERIVEVRQHLLWLKEEGLVENLAATWTAPNLSGYLSELQHVIQELTSVHARMIGVHKERTKLRLVDHEEG